MDVLSLFQESLGKVGVYFFSCQALLLTISHACKTKERVIHDPQSLGYTFILCMSCRIQCLPKKHREEADATNHKKLRDRMR